MILTSKIENGILLSPILRSWEKITRPLKCLRANAGSLSNLLSPQSIPVIPAFTLINRSHIYKTTRTSWNKHMQASRTPFTNRRNTPILPQYTPMQIRKIIYISPFRTPTRISLALILLILFRSPHIQANLPEFLVRNIRPKVVIYLQQTRPLHLHIQLHPSMIRR